MKKFRLLAIGGLCFLSLCGTLRQAPAQQEAHVQALMDKSLNALVTVRVVAKTEMKFSGQGRDSDMRTELQGAIVDAKGLIMLSNLPFSPAKMMSLMGGGGEGGDSQFGMKVTPTEFKVVFGREEKEYPAYLVATDTKLDLAFIQIENLNGRSIPIVDFMRGAVPKVGQSVMSFSRLPKGFDYAPYFTSARVSGLITKPRKAWVLDTPTTDFGLPVYTAQGETLGIITLIPPGVQSDSDSMDMMSMMSRNGGAGLHPFVVPSSVVQGVIEQARIRAKAVAQKRAQQRHPVSKKS